MKVVVKKKPKKIPTLLLLGAADERANTAPSLLHLPHETQFSQSQYKCLFRSALSRVPAPVCGESHVLKRPDVSNLLEQGGWQSAQCSTALSRLQSQCRVSPSSVIGARLLMALATTA